MMRSRYCMCVLCALMGLTLALLMLAPQAVTAQAPPAPRPAVSFIKDVAPIFQENCFACHDAKKRKGKLDMTTFENLRKGGDHDNPIVAGKPQSSYLVERITAVEAKRMPPQGSGDPLPAQQVALIQQWIREGATLGAGVEPRADLLRELRLRWQPPVPPAVYKYPLNVNAIAFTPDNQKLIIGGYHELLVWDLAQGKLEKRLDTRAERAYAMLFLADGKLAVAGARPGQEGDVRIYNLQGGTPRMENGVAILDGVHDKAVLLAELLETDDSVLCLALSADGKKLAAGGCDRQVRIWDLSAGVTAARLEQTIENHADWVLGIAFTPDGKQVLTASRDKTAKVWDLVSRESLVTFPEHQSTVYGVAVQPDGKMGISVGEDSQIRYWYVAGEGKQARNSGGHGKAIFKVIRHPKLPLLVTCSADDTVRTWNPDTGANLRTLTGQTDWVYALALSSDGALVASGAWNGEVRVWKVADGALVKAFNASPGLQPAAASPAPGK